MGRRTPANTSKLLAAGTADIRFFFEVRAVFPIPSELG